MLLETLAYARIQLIASSLLWAIISVLLFLVDMIDVAVWMFIPLGFVLLLSVSIFFSKPAKQTKSTKGQRMASFRTIKSRRVLH
ncbi:hypothetical protein WBJ53_17790 [Spirosoma sp. SC4-14]|uniref:hypothetical protein n=1 Tax=Spirosoma sp. SC4-14 TaxID=3128900 RepID=UPI0030CD4763